MMRIQYPNLLTTWCQRSNPTITWFRIMAFLENIWWGPIFGPVQNLDIVTWCICTPFHFWSTRILFEINDHEIEFRFWSTFKLIENPLLVLVHDHVIDKRFENSLLVHFHLFEVGPKAKFDHMVIYFEEKLGWTKSETACICFTWLYPSNSELNKKIGGSMYYEKFRTYIRIETLGNILSWHFRIVLDVSLRSWLNYCKRMRKVFMIIPVMRTVEWTSHLTWR